MQTNKADLEIATVDGADSLRSVEAFPPFDSVAHGDLLGLSLSAITTDLTHPLHRFPAKYIPQVPRWAISQFSQPGDTVLDPFMGSGTSLVEGLCSVRRTVGIDIDPLAGLITRAKTASYNLDRLLTLATTVLATERQGCKERFLPMTGVKNVEHWFRGDAWEDLSNLFATIENLQCTEPERTFFRCIFSSIIRRVSNADDQTQKTYVSGTLAKHPPPVWPAFRKSLERAISGVSALQKRRGANSADAITGSALSMPLDDDSVDLVVTSPPYVDSVDYMYNFMLEYFWLGPILGIPSRAAFNNGRRMTVGAKNPIDDSAQFPDDVGTLIERTDVPDYRRRAISAYFASMQTHFREASRILKQRGRYVLVIGNSQAMSGVIPVHDCLLRLARAYDLHLEKAFAYRIRRHYMKFPRKGRGGIILMDWVITLQKTHQPILKTEDRLPIPQVTIGHDEVAH